MEEGEVGGGEKFGPQLRDYGGFKVRRGQARGGRGA